MRRFHYLCPDPKEHTPGVKAFLSDGVASGRRQVLLAPDWVALVTSDEIPLASLRGGALRPPQFSTPVTQGRDLGLGLRKRLAPSPLGDLYEIIHK